MSGKNAPNSISEPSNMSPKKVKSTVASNVPSPKFGKLGETVKLNVRNLLILSIQINLNRKYACPSCAQFSSDTSDTNAIN